MAKIHPLFQPLVEHRRAGGSPTLYGVEALARTNAGDQSFIRETGFSWRSVDAAMATILSNSSALPGQIENAALFVNVSQYSLHDDVTFHRWLTLMQDLSVILMEDLQAKLVVEITEMVPDDSLAARWHSMKERGLLLAIDDFGTLNSNFNRLSLYDWDYCKYDMMETSDTDLKKGVMYCGNEGITSIAEKIEDKQSADKALDLGIMVHQGYHYSRPCSADAVPIFAQDRAVANHEHQLQPVALSCLG